MSKQKYTTTVTTVTTDGKPKQGKVNGYHSEKLHAAKDKRRMAAMVRQRHYESLTIKQRIALAQSRRGNSEKEQNRLFDLLDVNPAAVVAVTEKKTHTPKSEVVKAAKAQRPSKS